MSCRVHENMLKFGVGVSVGLFSSGSMEPVSHGGFLTPCSLRLLFVKMNILTLIWPKAEITDWLIIILLPVLAGGQSLPLFCHNWSWRQWKSPFISRWPFVACFGRARHDPTPRSASWWALRLKPAAHLHFSFDTAIYIIMRSDSSTASETNPRPKPLRTTCGQDNTPTWICAISGCVRSMSRTSETDIHCFVHWIVLCVFTNRCYEGKK